MTLSELKGRVSKISFKIDRPGHLRHFNNDPKTRKLTLAFAFSIGNHLTKYFLNYLFQKSMNINFAKLLRLGINVTADNVSETYGLIKNGVNFI